MNDVLAITDTSGTIVGNYEYDAWGTVTVADTEIAQQNPIRYRGYYYDNETGYCYLQSRYYDPSICRFINEDDAIYLDLNQIIGINLYLYCLDNPINNCDLKGTTQKKYHSVSLITTKQFYNETCVVNNNLKNYFDVNNSYTSVVHNGRTFTNAWNNLKECSVTVINCHGGYDGISTIINGMTRDQVLKLKNKKIKVLIILACHASELYNSRGQNIRFNNIASAFAQKVSGGIVVASDGIVSSNNLVSAQSKRQQLFVSRYGWYLYRQSGNRISMYSTTYSRSYSSITIRIILDYLVSCNLVRW